MRVLEMEGGEDQEEEEEEEEEWFIQNRKRARLGATLGAWEECVSKRGREGEKDGEKGKSEVWKYGEGEGGRGLS